MDKISTAPEATERIQKCIVMPAAHGKSYREGRYINAVEMEKVYDYHKDSQLSKLRADAWMKTNDWHEYDTLYAKYLKQYCTKEYLFVPSVDLALEVGVIAAVFTLPLSVCVSNISVRGHSYMRHTNCYEMARRHAMNITCESNDILTEKLDELLSKAPLSE